MHIRIPGFERKRLLFVKEVNPARQAGVAFDRKQPSVIRFDKIKRDLSGVSKPIYKRLNESVNVFVRTVFEMNGRPRSDPIPGFIRRMGDHLPVHSNGIGTDLHAFNIGLQDPFPVEIYVAVPIAGF